MPPDANDRRNATSHSTAHYFLEGLTETGIEYLFCNFGTDHAPIIEDDRAVDEERQKATEDRGRGA
jgi:acetolactate synthase-1/2/3 large subunit